jgi:hypothetical protein
MEWLAEEVESPWELLAAVAMWLEAVLAEMGVVAMWTLAELAEPAKLALAC